MGIQIERKISIDTVIAAIVLAVTLFTMFNRLDERLSTIEGKVDLITPIVFRAR